MLQHALLSLSRRTHAGLGALLGVALTLGAGAAHAEPSKGVSKGGEHSPSGASSPADSGSSGGRSERDDRTRTVDTEGRTPAEARTERIAGIALTGGGAALGGLGAALLVAGSSSQSAGSTTLQPVGGLVAGIGGLGLLVGVPLLIHSLMGTDKPPAAPAPGLEVSARGLLLRF